MALPPQAIEKLIREPSHTQGAYRELLLISGALFGLAVVIYAGLAFGYKAYLNSSLAAVESQVSKFNTGISQEDRSQIQGFYSQLVNLRTLLAGHTAASPVLGLLERTAQPDVYYTKLTINTVSNQAVVSGAGRSLESIAVQVAALQAQPEVDHLEFNNAGAQTAGPWQFTLAIHLKPNTLHGAVINAPVIAPVVVAPVSTSTLPTVTSTPTSTPRP